MTAVAEAEFTYVNLHIANATPQWPLPAASLSFSPNGLLAEHASDKDLAIGRATIVGCRTLPAFIPLIDTTQVGGNTNTCVYRMWIVQRVDGPSGVVSWRDGGGGASMTWVPQDATAPPPQPATPTTGQDVSSNYYYAYDVQYVVSLLNNLLQAAVAANTTYTQYMYNAVFTFNPSTSLITLTSPQTQSSPNPPSSFPTFVTALYWIIVNEPLRALLSNFVFTSGTSESSTDPTMYNAFYNKGAIGTTAYALVDGPSFGATLVSPAPPPGLQQQPAIYATTQSSQSVGAWSPVSAFAFTSSNLPAAFEVDATPLLYGTVSPNASGSSTLTNVLTDIAVDTSGHPEVVNDTVIYEPATLRWISLVGGSPIRDVSLRLMWRGAMDGLLRPVTLSTGASISFKLLFRDKRAS
jgi:hypothetical protein